jgi:hypothetical protein
MLKFISPQIKILLDDYPKNFSASQDCRKLAITMLGEYIIIV